MPPPTYNPERHHRHTYRRKGYDYSRPGWYYVTICLHDLGYMLAGTDRNACPWRNAPRDCCCDNRPCLRLTEVGRIADRYWREIPSHASNVELDEYVIMPDHMHGILRLTGTHRRDPEGRRGIQPDLDMARIRDVQLNVPTDTSQSVSSSLSPSPADLAISSRGAWAGRSMPFPPTDPHFISGPFASPTSSSHSTANPDAAPKDQGAPVDQARSRISPRSGTLSVIIRTYKGAVKTWANSNGFGRFRWQKRFYDHIIRNKEELARIRWYIRNNPGSLIPGSHGNETELKGNGWRAE